MYLITFLNFICSFFKFSFIIFRHCKMDLNTALSDSKIAIHLFFNNKFDDAQHILEPWYVPTFNTIIYIYEIDVLYGFTMLTIINYNIVSCI